ncbi:MAG: hypothetical protein P4L84_33385 [Isosphaeraceae bacterium]|nr:hypothetical protein [Isosphaeraceae bacterium]
MQGHDHRSVPARISAWCGLVLLIIVGSARAQSPGQALRTPSPDAGAAGGPVALNARQVRAWTADSVEWIILSRQAAVAQDLFDLRADQIVVRISRGGDSVTPVKYVDIYAETGAQVLGTPGPPQREFRTRLITRQEIRARAFEEKGLLKLAGAPANFPILLRAFPAETVAIRNAASATPKPNVDATAVLAPVEAKLTQRDSGIARTQATQVEVAPPVETRPGGNGPEIDLPPIEGAPTVPNLQPAPVPVVPPTTVEPLPGPDGKPAPPVRQERPAAPPPLVPILPGSARVTRIYPRNGGPDFQIERLKTTAEGVDIIIIRGGVNIVTTSPPPTGTVDLSADSVIIWRQTDPKFNSTTGPNGETIDPVHAPMEVYLEGHVLFQQDQRRLAGSADQKTIRANSAYYDFRSDRLITLDAELDLFAPGLIAPAKITSPRIEQYRPMEYGPDGQLRYGLERLRADRSIMTGSRFPNPGYRIKNRSVDLTKIVNPKANPSSGQTVKNPRDPNAPREQTWFYDARQNFFFFGPVPVFYWPRFSGTADDLDPPLRTLAFRSNNYLGQQLLVDFNAFKLFNIPKPPAIDIWTLNVDYLSARTKEFPALGSEIGWFGRDVVNDILDPYHRNVVPTPGFANEHFGYFDIWGLKDFGTDDLGPGLAIITNNNKAANVGITRLAVPPFQQDRLRITARHMQYFGDYDPDDPSLSEMRMQVELGYYTDRYFLEEYYKRLTETGLDQETLAYFINQKDSSAWSVWTEGNLMPWQTETQWFPRLDYYRFGDSLLGNRLTYYQHSGIDYANVHTALEVNNPYVFAFIPYDPISNTTGTFQSGRVYTNHEVDLPLQFDFIRLTPYVQGQFAGWNNQIAGNSVGRVWGGAGARLDLMAWKAFPEVESELFNVHGLNHKVNFQLDYRDAYSNVNLNKLGVQDDLDDNEYEYVRRYFAMTTYVGSLLPAQYDPRFLMLRRVLSPISGPTDIQASINTLQMNIHQRLQTKRGPEGKRRIIDYMTLDLSSTYFPQASRDNFGKPFGQNMYNWQWFVGDRTSVFSYGWFEFFNIGGQPTVQAAARHNDPFGLNVVTSGISITRPPRTVLTLTYTVLDTGPISTSALGTSINYWLSPKYYGTFSNSYDFGNNISLGTGFSVTRIGADWLSSIGFTVDPQRMSYMAAVSFSPRISPGLSLGGSGVGLSQLDTRYAPTQ